MADRYIAILHGGETFLSWQASVINQRLINERKSEGKYEGTKRTRSLFPVSNLSWLERMGANFEKKTYTNGFSVFLLGLLLGPVSRVFRISLRNTRPIKYEGFDDFAAVNITIIIVEKRVIRMLVGSLAKENV